MRMVDAEATMRQWLTRQIMAATTLNVLYVGEQLLLLKYFEGLDEGAVRTLYAYFRGYPHEFAGLGYIFLETYAPGGGTFTCRNKNAAVVHLTKKLWTETFQWDDEYV